MTEERFQSLEELDFEWGETRKVWGAKHKQLANYKNEFGHTNVLPTDPKFKQLGIW